MSQVLDSKVYQVIDENQAEVERLSTDVQEGIHEEIKKQLVFDDKNFTGDLSKSFVKITEDNGFKAVVTSNPYAVPVDKGMPPGVNVNFDRLYIWVQGKLGISDPDEARSVTFKIRQKILANGIPASRFVKKAIKRFIGKHGALSTTRRTPRKKTHRLTKIIRKIERMTRRAVKMSRKASKHINRLNKLSSGKI